MVMTLNDARRYRRSDSWTRAINTPLPLDRTDSWEQAEDLTSSPHAVITMNATNQINADVPAEQQGATTDEADAVNPAVPAEQQCAARFKQLNRVVQQVLLLAAFALSDIFTALGREARNLIFLHGGDQWSGVIPHFFQVRCVLLDGRLISHCRSCW